MDRQGYTENQYRRFRKLAMMTLFGYAFMYAFLYNGRLNMNLALPEMMDDLGIGASQAGVITSALFWCYGLGHLFAGRLGEIAGNRRLISMGIILTIGLNLVVSFQSSPAVIAVIWGLNGLAQSLVFAPGISLNSNWWPSSERGFFTGVIAGASGISQISAWLCVMAAFALIPSQGWRAAFRYPLILLFIFAVIFILVSRENPEKAGLPPYREDREDVAREEKKRMAERKERGPLYPYLVLLRNRKFVMFIFIMLIIGIARHGLLTWIPLYYVDSMGMEVDSGMFSSVVLPLGMTAGYIMMPVISDRIFHSRREPLIIICSVAITACLFIFPNISSVAGASAVLFLTGSLLSVSSIVWAFATDAGTRAFAGTAAGMLDSATYIGAGIQSVLFGAILETSGGWNMVFLFMGGLFLLIIVFAYASFRMGR